LISTQCLILTDGLQYLSTKKMILKLSTLFYPKITPFELSLFSKFIDNKEVGLFYHDDYFDLKILKPMRIISDKLNISLVRSDDFGHIPTNSENKVIKYYL